METKNSDNNRINDIDKWNEFFDFALHFHCDYDELDAMENKKCSCEGDFTEEVIKLCRAQQVTDTKQFFGERVLENIGIVITDNNYSTNSALFDNNYRNISRYIYCLIAANDIPANIHDIFAIDTLHCTPEMLEWLVSTGVTIIYNESGFCGYHGIVPAGTITMQRPPRGSDIIYNDKNNEYYQKYGIHNRLSLFLQEEITQLVLSLIDPDISTFDIFWDDDEKPTVRSYGYDNFATLLSCGLYEFRVPERYTGGRWRTTLFHAASLLLDTEDYRKYDIFVALEKLMSIIRIWRYALAQAHTRLTCDGDTPEELEQEILQQIKELGVDVIIEAYKKGIPLADLLIC